MVTAPAALSGLLSRWLAGVAPRTPRTLREFAAAEVVIPNGPQKGKLFDPDFQPWNGQVLDMFSTGKWRRLFATGSVQSGKTFITCVIPAMYHLFEIGEDIGLGAPTTDLAWSVFKDRILPAIQASEYRHLLPKSGGGSKGGRPSDNAIRFANGATLRLFGAGGGDEQRSSHTVRVMIITEIDKMDEAGSVSREANPVSQLEARTASFGDRALIYAECTVSTEEGMVWREVEKLGTGSKIVLRCPHCGLWDYPERENFRGWVEADNEIEARENGAYVCPGCGVAWSERDRKTALRDPRILHRGQEITPEGKIVGSPPPVTTLGIRWNAMHSGLLTQANIAEKEFRGKQTDSPDDEKYLCQFVWTRPYRDSLQNINFDEDFLLRKSWRYGFGEIPEGVKFTVAAIDVQKKSVYWLVNGYDDELTCWPIEWSMHDMVSMEEKRFPTEHEVRNCLTELADMLFDRFNLAALWIDCGYNPAAGERHVVRQWAAEQNGGVFPLVGRSESQYKGQKIEGKALETAPGVPNLIAPRQQPDGRVLWFLDVDRLKDECHSRILRDLKTPGCVYLPRDVCERKPSLIKHILAEKRVVRWEQGKGDVRLWTAVGKRRDLWDCHVYNLAAAYVVRAYRQLESESSEPSAPPSAEKNQSPTIRTEY